MAKKEIAIQDGPDFYDDATGEVIASYPDSCTGDGDIVGAEKARSRFLAGIWGNRFTVEKPE